MKILMIITGMQSGGAERVMATLCNELSKKNQVRLVVMKGSKSDYKLDDNVEVVAGNILKQNIVQSVSFVSKEFDYWNPDVALAFMTKSNIIALLAARKSKINVPIVIAERANPYYAKRIFKIIRRFLYPTASGCVFQTEQAKQYYNGILKCQSIVLRNPLNADFVVRTYHGVRTKRIVTVGRLSIEKNQKLLIEAFSRIANSYKDYCLEIYGDGPLKDELKSIIESKGLSSQIRLMGRQNHIENHIRDAEIFVLPSNSEGMPNALLEAMALGIACIATDCPIGGSAYIINDKKNGLLVPMNDVEKMVEAIKKLIDDKEFAKTLGTEAEKVIYDFDTGKVCAEWENYLYNVWKISH